MGPRPPRSVSGPTRVRVCRGARIPDPVRLERHRHAPELGVRPCFFSGGTALREASRELVDFTHNSIHVVTPFDSGGSSAELRRAFGMPAVGDLRNRLLALADRSVRGHPEIYDLFRHRLPTDASREELRESLDAMVEGSDPRVRAVPGSRRALVRAHLALVRDRMPADFDLRGANVGNLVLAGGYLEQERALDSVLFLFGRLVEARGTVRPVVDEDLQLVAELEDGRTVAGQHRLTGRRVPELDSPVRRLYLSVEVEDPRPVRPRIPDAVDALVRSADLICYPVGSFFTSVVANLLPAGVGEAVAATDVPKVYVPNPGRDPEELGMALSDKVRTLLRHLRADAGEGTPTGDLLHFVLVDVRGSGISDEERRRVEAEGVEVVDRPLVSAGGPRLDARRFVEALLSFC